MSEAHAHRPDPVSAILGQAIWVFAGLGTAQIIVAIWFHKVALGADGVHNFLEFVILGASRLAHTRELGGEKNFLNCQVVPRAPQITSYGTVIATIAFLVISHGGEAEAGSWLALGLVLVSMLVNSYYALQMHDHREVGTNAHASWRHLLGDALASLLAAVAYLVIALGGPVRLDPIMAVAGAAVILVVHIEPIRRGRRDVKYHRWPDHTHESDHPH